MTQSSLLHYKAIAMVNVETLVLEGEMSEMLSLMKKTFYSNKEIFLRELINNASNVSYHLNLILYLYISFLEQLLINMYLDRL